MSSMNKVQLIGNLGANPEIRTFQNGGKVANLRIATSETWKDRQTGERKERTEWHTIAVFNEGLVGIVERYVKKGSKIYVEGKLQTRKWRDASGNEHYITEIILNGYDAKIILLSSPGDGQGSQHRRGSGYGSGNGGYGQSGGDQQDRGTRSWHGDGYNDLDDEIPF